MPPDSDPLAEPLRSRIVKDKTALYRVLINLDTTANSGSVQAAAGQVASKLKELLGKDKSKRTEQHILFEGDDDRRYLKARLQGQTISALVLAMQGTSVISSIVSDADDVHFFNPDNLVRTVIAVPLLTKIEADLGALHDVQIELNINCEEGRPAAKARLAEMIVTAIRETGADPGAESDVAQGASEWKSALSDQYTYARLSGSAIRKLVHLDESTHREKSAAEKIPEMVDADKFPDRAAVAATPEATGTRKVAQGPTALKRSKDWRILYHIWPDFPLRAQIWRSVVTIKADACRRSFATTGRGIVWAIFDSGIDGTHPHFAKHSNLLLPGGLQHMDFTQLKNPQILPAESLVDDYGHGTHVAGIIAGELDDAKYRPVSLGRERNQDGVISFKEEIVTSPVAGVAPQCTLLSYKVLDSNGEGSVSTVVAAIEYVQQLNGYGRNLVVHGVNMSLGYDFDPEWFACGQSPICTEVDRLVRSGVAVVIAAGNTGKGFALTINDPGNAELAVTVGSTHREMPHRYGVSYFSSKGPTADGRAKPDLLAPGERILSCGAGPDLTAYKEAVASEGTQVSADPNGRQDVFYLERSGTSMAAPHVSGIVAGILSTRGEFIGLPEDMKSYLVKSAIDLGRERAFQGGGLVDMMRTIQAM